MNSPTEATAVFNANHDATNRRLLARKVIAKSDHIESASRKVSITLCSPEGKRLYLRCFEITQVNFHYITVFAHMKVSEQEVGRIEQEIRNMLENRLVRVNQALADMEAQCVAQNVASLATYDVEPLLLETKVFSMLDRRLLELIEKVDQLMPMLETLCIDEAITPSQLVIEKSKLKNMVRGAAKAVRIARATLQRQANAGTASAAATAGASTDVETPAQAPRVTSPEPLE
ncbi:hypothetical protein GCM10027277_25230 [Pseudoduganella ginsengisoli]|uniref:DUF1845 domain-containing protein n=1 Tax=Pseudoduganella ginsengisoli TaxID=1462440 RepID=A0A6L6Q020_9BURK|nr:hypothetical protein [Pseudoduganella ginsengisoli]MTW02754.1 hypothetical protein [Pseudoduganella ginsengisoli]